MLALFFALVYIPVMRREEEHLRALFGKEYASYANEVPLLLPRLTAWRAATGPEGRFDTGLYRSNREYEALLAFVVIVLALCAKMLWRA